MGNETEELILNEQEILEFLARYFIKKVHFTSGVPTIEVLEQFFSSFSLVEENSDTYIKRKDWFIKIVNKMAKEHVTGLDNEGLGFLYKTNGEIKLFSDVFLFDESFNFMIKASAEDVSNKYEPHMDLNNGFNDSKIIDLLNEALNFVDESIYL